MYSVVLVSANSELRDKLGSELSRNKQIIIAECADLDTFYNHILGSPFDMVVLGESLSKTNPVFLMREVLKLSPSPILHVRAKSDEIEDEIYNLGFVDYVDLDLSDPSEIPSIFIIKTLILAKLNMKKFQYQLEAFLQDQPIISPDRVIKTPDLKPIKSGITNRKRINYPNLSKIVVIGASTGGPSIIKHICQQLPSKFPPVLVVQHMPKGFIKSFADRIDKTAEIKVKIAEQNEEIKSGVVYISPGGVHMEALRNKDKTYINLSDGPPVNFVKPAVDVTLFSVARLWGSNTISMILTGMGHDGREGTRMIKAMGGKSIVLSEADSVVYGMNKSIVDEGLADRIAGIVSITSELIDMI